MERGVLTISLDFELIWGALDLFEPEAASRFCTIERAVVVDRLLDLFVEFNVSATWCVVGHLLLGGCRAQNGTRHPEIMRPRHAWCSHDWFAHDPCGTEESHPLFYGRSLVEKIRACPVSQEIGCHSFSHVIFGDSGCSRDTAESEVAACVNLAKEMGIEMKSFVFPRDQVGHLDVLADYGFVCYRGPEPHWYNKGTWPALVKRACHLWEVLTAAQPPVTLPQRAPFGLWNIPGSMIYFPIHGLRRYIPMSLRIKRVKKGLIATSQKRQIFHLWFHPTNLAYDVDKMFSGLRTILEFAHDLRTRGQLVIMPMRALPGMYTSE